MPEFSACYFCGTALDAPLAEYPVVPESLHPSADQQRTVVLCSTCRRKVGAVVDTVVAAIDDAPDADSVQRELTGSKDNGAYTSADSENGPAQRLDDEGESAAGAEVSVAVDADDEEGGFEFEDTTDRDDGLANASTGEGDDELAGDEQAMPVDNEQRAGDGAAVGADDDATEAAAEDGSQTDAVGEAESTDETIDDDPQMTALEYNKVMRLLQNREFPVDLQEFKVVATNAYQISDDEFDAVIEAATDRGLIALERGRIVDA